MNLTVEFDREEDGRWIAEIEALPGVMAHGSKRLEAQERIEALATRAMAERGNG